MWTGFKLQSSHSWTLVNTVMTLQVPKSERITRQTPQDELCLYCPFLSSYSNRGLQLNIDAVLKIRETKHSYEQNVFMGAPLKNKISTKETLQSENVLQCPFDPDWSSCGFEATDDQVLLNYLLLILHSFISPRATVIAEYQQIKRHIPENQGSVVDPQAVVLESALKWGTTLTCSAVLQLQQYLHTLSPGEKAQYVRSLRKRKKLYNLFNYTT